MAIETSEKTASQAWNGKVRDVFLASLETVNGRFAVSQALNVWGDFRPTMIVALGKAAVAMFEGSHARYPELPAFIVTKYGHGRPSGSKAKFIEAGHPVPDENSLRAGEALSVWLESARTDARLLMLVSGGASSLVERLALGKTLQDLRDMTATALAEGRTIEELNGARSEISEIKGGKLLSRFAGCEVRVLAISDVASDDVDLIGSGIGGRGTYSGDYEARVIASNQILRADLAQHFKTMGLKVVANCETLSAPVETVVADCLHRVEQGGPGVYIYGGEPTIILPENPGVGGRAQALALMFAKAISGRTNFHVLVSGTDGSDGVSEATGAVVDGSTFARLQDAEGYLRRADSGTYFNKTGEAIVTGPTGTNVADIAILVRE
jgi:glycerate 2-kinase